MKTLSDNTEIEDRLWYYLLDFNDSDEKKTIQSLGKQLLKDLTKNEFYELFRIATESDLKGVDNTPIWLQKQRESTKQVAKQVNLEKFDAETTLKKMQCDVKLNEYLSMQCKIKDPKQQKQIFTHFIRETSVLDNTYPRDYYDSKRHFINSLKYYNLGNIIQANGFNSNSTIKGGYNSVQKSNPNSSRKTLAALDNDLFKMDNATIERIQNRTNS